jgi:hypothetical protein
MARTKATLGAGARLSDFLSASLLARVFPADQVHEVLDAHGCNSQRVRSLPAVSTVYYCMALSLYSEAAYEEVFAVVAQGLAWADGRAEPPGIAKSAISAARARVGWPPLAALVQKCCVPMADPQLHPQAFYAGLRLVAIDGSNFEIPDEAENAAEFGYPGSRTGHAGYPQAQCAVLVECATHAILAANLDRYAAPEWQVCEPLLGSMDASMLCLADRGFSGIEYWRKARATGAHLLWRCSEKRKLPVLQELDDGSFLSEIRPSNTSRQEAEARAIQLRVIEYTLPGLPDGQSRYRLLTSILDDKLAPASELAALYHERWHVEAVFDELKTHLRQGRRLLRSKTAAGVRQEFYGWALAHYAVRWLLHQGTGKDRIPHAKQSFTKHLHLLRRTQPQSGAFPPKAPPSAKPLVH